MFEHFALPFAFTFFNSLFVSFLVCPNCCFVPIVFFLSFTSVTTRCFM